MITIRLPVNEDTLKTLHAGDRVLLSGVLYAARDQAHLRLVNELDSPPFPLQNAAVYYVGPTPAKPGHVTGSSGPTSAYRMDSLSLPLMKKGVKIMIGKGERASAFQKGCIEHKAIYLLATGGAGALLASKIIDSKIIAYPDLGPEAIRELKVENFPCLVAYDIHGKRIFRSDNV